MERYNRIAVTKLGITVQRETVTATLTAAQIGTRTRAEIQDLLRTGAGKNDLWVHKNRDGSLALATGIEPKIWPEDAPVEVGPPRDTTRNAHA